MQPTRTELLEAWMTIIKVLDYYGPDYVDEYHKQVLPDVLSLLDKLQKDERCELSSIVSPIHQTALSTVVCLPL